MRYVSEYHKKHVHSKFLWILLILQKRRGKAERIPKTIYDHTSLKKSSLENKLKILKCNVIKPGFIEAIKSWLKNGHKKLVFRTFSQNLQEKSIKLQSIGILSVINSATYAKMQIWKSLAERVKVYHVNYKICQRSSFPPKNPVQISL